MFTRYALERFLFRLGRSEYTDRFILKGALLLFVWQGRIQHGGAPFRYRGCGITPQTSESCLPTVLRSGPYRFFFYMADSGERPHVHVERDGLEAKLWLDPVTIARAGSFRPVELRRIERIVEEHRYMLLEQWDADFGV